MFNTVIIAEKPAMGESIAKALGMSSKKKGYILLTNGDVVTWAIGHLIRLITPNNYPEYKEWSLDTLPVIPKKMQTEVDPSKLEQFNVIKYLLFNSKQCILATDPDREGEHIGRLILKECGYTKEFKRLWIDDLTPTTIINGMKHLRSSDDLTPLAQAAQARSYADYWLGFTASRFFSLVAQEVTGGRANLSAGRVQTPTLRLVYDRELTMENFQPKEFYNLIAEFKGSHGSYKGIWFKEGTEKTNRLYSQNEIERLKQVITASPAEVVSYQVKDIKKSAPQLFNLSALKTASRKYLGYSTVKTTDLLQSLYDKEYVTYPRVDSSHLSENKANELARDLNTLRETSEFKALFPINEIESLVGNSRFVDNQKAATHHAIVPTSKDPELFLTDSKYKITSDEKKLYELILKHTLAAHYPAGINRETQIITSVSGETFVSKSIEVVSEGWRSLYQITDEQSQESDREILFNKLPHLEKGERVSVQSFEVGKGQTTKPKRLNDDELEILMENAGRYVDPSLNDAIINQLKQRGIGTPATRTNIVQKLVDQEYIEIKKNLIYLTSKGRSFMEMVYDHPVASIELTGEFEMQLGQIEKQKLSLQAFLAEFEQFTRDILLTKDALRDKIVSLSRHTHTFENVEEIGSCPKCNSPVLNQAKLYSCSSSKSSGCDFIIWRNFRGVTIRAKQVQDLIAGKEIELKNIPGKDGKPSYNLYLFLKDGQLSSRLPCVEDYSLGSCPKCGKPVVENTKSYGCSDWKAGCSFSIWKTYRNSEISVKVVKSLLSGKEILIDNIPGDKGPYSLILFIQNGMLQNRFPTPEDLSIGNCPCCKNPVVEFKNYYVCSHAKQGCSFKLPKDFLGKSISLSNMKKLLRNGKSDKIDGFTGNKNTFSAALGYDRVNNRYSFL